MISFDQIGGAGSYAAYHDQSNQSAKSLSEYYSGERVTSGWGGNLSNQLIGMNSKEFSGQEVNKNDLERSLSGDFSYHNQQGEVVSQQLGRTRINQQTGEVENQHRAGFDFTISAPKTFSVAIEVWNDKDLRQAHLDAAERAMKHLESKAVARVNGKRVHTNNISYARHDHSNSRTGDPQTHSHFAVQNATMHGGKLYSLENREMLKARTDADRIYQNQLEKAAQKLGYETYRVQNKGSFSVQIKGYEQQAQHFSGRSMQMSDYIKNKWGIDKEQATAKQRQEAALATREAKKLAENSKEARELWQKEVERMGFQPIRLSESGEINHPAKVESNLSESILTPKNNSVLAGSGLAAAEKVKDFESDNARENANIPTLENQSESGFREATEPRIPTSIEARSEMLRDGNYNIQQAMQDWKAAQQEREFQIQEGWLDRIEKAMQNEFDHLVVMRGEFNAQKALDWAEKNQDKLHDTPQNFVGVYETRAHELAEAGILEEKAEGHFVFVDDKAREILQQNAGADADVMRLDNLSAYRGQNRSIYEIPATEPTRQESRMLEAEQKTFNTPQNKPTEPKGGFSPSSYRRWSETVASKVENEASKLSYAGWRDKSNSVSALAGNPIREVTGIGRNLSGHATYSVVRGVFEVVGMRTVGHYAGVVSSAFVRSAVGATFTLVTRTAGAVAGQTIRTGANIGKDLLDSAKQAITGRGNTVSATDSVRIKNAQSSGIARSGKGIDANDVYQKMKSAQNDRQRAWVEGDRNAYDNARRTVNSSRAVLNGGVNLNEARDWANKALGENSIQGKKYLEGLKNHAEELKTAGILKETASGVYRFIDAKSQEILANNTSATTRELAKLNAQSYKSHQAAERGAKAAVESLKFAGKVAGVLASRGAKAAAGEVLKGTTRLAAKVGWQTTKAALSVGRGVTGAVVRSAVSAAFGQTSAKLANKAANAIGKGLKAAGKALVASAKKVAEKAAKEFVTKDKSREQKAEEREKTEEKRKEEDKEKQENSPTGQVRDAAEMAAWSDRDREVFDDKEKPDHQPEPEDKEKSEGEDHQPAPHNHSDTKERSESHEHGGSQKREEHEEHEHSDLEKQAAIADFKSARDALNEKFEEREEKVEEREEKEEQREEREEELER